MAETKDKNKSMREKLNELEVDLEEAMARTVNAKANAMAMVATEALEWVVALGVAWDDVYRIRKLIKQSKENTSDE